MKRNRESGIAHVIIIVFMVLLVAIGAVGYMVFTKQQKSEEPITAANAEQAAQSATFTIKHLGINLDAYDATTNKAGDLQFSKAQFTSGFQMLFFDYGFEVPASSAAPARRNPQPTFIVPLGTKVHSLVDGTVYDVPTLYSNDYSIQVSVDGSDAVVETEHVIKPLVKKGDKVKAGDVIAEVSDYDARNYDGMGLVEIGILIPGNPPSHVCPFDYLDASIKQTTLDAISKLKSEWEAYRGDTTIYDESKEVIPGCLTRDPVEG